MIASYMEASEVFDDTLSELRSNTRAGRSTTIEHL
jgi:hypothetical protein